VLELLEDLSTNYLERTNSRALWAAEFSFFFQVLLHPMKSKPPSKMASKGGSKDKRDAKPHSKGSKGGFKGKRDVKPKSKGGGPKRDSKAAKVPEEKVASKRWNRDYKKEDSAGAKKKPETQESKNNAKVR
jgi:hypothetical protein